MDPLERKTAVGLVNDDIADDAPHDDDEPTTEELIEMLRESLEDVKAGRTRPVRELLRELREMTAEDADPS
ncbi:MAG: hypothetical protein OXI30_00755 [Chloroflexota bacterium]|nr:hypothetical protein [Chloroflexota bacterium]